MPKNNFQNDVNSNGVRRLVSVRANNPEENPLDGARPMSISMGPTLIWLNAIGDPDARAITAAWRPVFKITPMDTLPEHVGWQ